MANPEHLEILKQGVEVWNRWREENPDVQADLSEANIYGENLREMDLSEANLSLTNLSNADLRKANLNKANLSKARLVRAKLSEANLRQVYCNGTDLRSTYLDNVDFSGARLVETDLSGAYLHQTDLSNVTVGYCNFGAIDLSTVTGLVAVKHTAPSTIGIDTIYRSNGKISEAFLRGAGVPDIFITYIASLTAKAIQYYSCFISYSSKDQGFAQRLYADLQQNGVRCWFAPEDMKIGDKIRPAIDQSIRIHDKLLLILSENSLSSFWVESEVEKAFEEERQRGQTILFPVRLDEAVMDTGQPWAAEIRRTRHIGDFSRWKDHDSYQEAFERLLRDLKAEG